MVEVKISPLENTEKEDLVNKVSSTLPYQELRDHIEQKLEQTEIISSSITRKDFDDKTHYTVSYKFDQDSTVIVIEVPENSTKVCDARAQVKYFNGNTEYLEYIVWEDGDLETVELKC